MKTQLVTLILILFAQLSFSQSLIVNKKDSSKVSVLLDDIESITFEDFGLTDPRDRHSYKTVMIGNQLWMAENLAFLPAVSPSATGSDTNPYYYVYGYEGSSVSAAKATANYSTYGVLYNWEAAKTACPSGWHLGTITDWTILINYLEPDAGKKMKATSGWSNGGNGDNSSGFTAFPGSNRSYDGSLGPIGDYTRFWVSLDDGSSDAGSHDLRYDSNQVIHYSTQHGDGFSVRCIRN